MKKWAEEEISLLKNNYEKLGVIELSRILNRKYYSVQKKARKLGLRFKYRSWKEETDFLIADENAILTYEAIIKTFSPALQKLAFDYIKAKLLRKQGLKLKGIANELKISEQTLRGWSSKTTPRAIRCVMKLTQLGLLPLVSGNTPIFKAFLETFAWIFGDGNLNNCLTAFIIAGERKTLEILEEKLKSISPTLKCKLKTEKTRGEFQGRVIAGECSCLTVNHAAISRLLYAAGAPKGDKVAQPFKLPRWIFELPDELKSLFLGVLWSADGTKPVWTKNDFYLCFQLNKILDFKKEHEDFMNDLRELLAGLGIKSGSVKWSNRPYMRNRDGKISDKSYFYVSCSAENYVKFFKSVPNFSTERDEQCLKALAVAEEKISRSRTRYTSFLEAKKRFENGETIKEISGKLQIPYSTIKVWVRGINSPVKLFSDANSLNAR